MEPRPLCDGQRDPQLCEIMTTRKELAAELFDCVALAFDPDEAYGEIAGRILQLEAERDALRNEVEQLKTDRTLGKYVMVHPTLWDTVTKRQDSLAATLEGTARELDGMNAALKDAARLLQGVMTALERFEDSDFEGSWWFADQLRAAIALADRPERRNIFEEMAEGIGAMNKLEP